MKLYIKSILLVLGYYVIILILYSILDLLGIAEMSTGLVLLSDVFIQIFSVATIYILYRKLNLFFKFNKMSIEPLELKSYIIIIGVSISCFILTDVYKLFFKASESIAGNYTDIEVYYQLLTAILIAPICEEIMFRGIILNNFISKDKVKSGIIFNSILFASMHYSSLDRVVGAFIFGILASLVYVKYKSIWGSILAHIVSNAIIFVFYYLSNHAKIGISYIAGYFEYKPIYYFLSAIFLIIFLVKFYQIEDRSNKLETY